MDGDYEFKTNIWIVEKRDLLMASSLALLKNKLRHTLDSVSPSKRAKINSSLGSLAAAYSALWGSIISPF
jgi:hypothetical protein